MDDSVPDWQVPLAAVRLTDADIAAAEDVYRSGWLSMGPRTEQLESAFSEYARVEHCVAVSSCTAGLHLACRGAGLGPGDEAIVPSITFIATANAVAYTGAEPVFAEIAAIDRPWLSTEAVERALSERTKAILPVSYGGHPGESHLGTFGLAGAISFSAGKNLGVGEGGVLLTDDAELAGHLRLMRWHGVTASIWERHRAETEGYGVSELGFNYRIDDARAALARSRLSRLDADNQRRAAIDAAYRRELGSLGGLTLTAAPPPGARSSHSMFAVVLPVALDREEFRRSLADRGVQTSVHFSPVHRFQLYADSGADLPLSDDYASRTVSLPMFAEMDEPQQELVIDSVKRALA
jgi:dTDP-4-amino-4,6-dideoxygalactose transaminase